VRASRTALISAISVRSLSRPEKGVARLADELLFEPAVAVAGYRQVNGAVSGEHRLGVVPLRLLPLPRPGRVVFVVAR
jgi:hypothetical protein